MELRPERRRDLRRAEMQERLRLLLLRIRPEIQPAAHPEIRQEPEWRLEITRPAVLGTHPVQPAALPEARLPQPPPAAVQVLRL